MTALVSILYGGTSGGSSSVQSAQQSVQNLSGSLFFVAIYAAFIAIVQVASYKAPSRPPTKCRKR